MLFSELKFFLTMGRCRISYLRGSGGELNSKGLRSYGHLQEIPLRVRSHHFT
jgi:hypothetical protein